MAQHVVCRCRFTFGAPRKVGPLWVCRSYRNGKVIVALAGLTSRQAERRAIRAMQRQARWHRFSEGGCPVGPFGEA